MTEVCRRHGFSEATYYNWKTRYAGMDVSQLRRLKELEPLDVPAGANEVWSMDFMLDALWSGRRFRTFNVIDDYNRESLRVDIDTSLPAARVIRALTELVELRGKPRR